MKLLNLVGQKFGRLVVQRRAKNTSTGRVRWKCKCICGTTVIVRGADLRTGRTQSCGCLHRERTSAACQTHGQSRPGKRSSEYSVWASMMTRCTNPNHHDWKRYGGRGITVCLRWRKFENFFVDVGPKPSPKRSLGRLFDVSNYGPGEAFWQTRAEQEAMKLGKKLLLRMEQGDIPTEEELRQIIAVQKGTK